MKTRLTKKYYVPGLISVIIVPLLFGYFGNQRVDDTIYNVVDLGIPSKPNPEREKLYPESTFETYRNWTYKKIIVSPNSALKNQKHYVSELKKLQKENIKETGIEFVIDDKNNYQDFIALIDAMTLAKQDNYGVDMDKTGHFFAVHIYVDPNQNKKNDFQICGYDTVNIRTKQSDSYKGFTKFNYQLSQLPKDTFYLIFGYLFFLHISVLGLIKKSI